MSAVEGTGARPELLTGRHWVYIHLYMRNPMIDPKRVNQAAIQSCTCFNLRKAARAVTQLYDDVIRPSGLRATQFSLLTVIRIAKKLSITDLAQEAVMDRTTLKRNLELLEREGLVRIQPGEDARVREVSLTPAAQKKLSAAYPYWARAQAQVRRRLGPARADRLLPDLSAAVAAAQPKSER